MINDKELEELLLKSNLLSKDAIERAIADTYKLKRPLENVILDLNLLPRSVLYGAIAKHQGFICRNLDDFKPEPELLKLVPEELARQAKCIPVKIEGGTLHIAMRDPSDLYLIDQIQRQVGMLVEACLSSPQEIEEAQNRIYKERPMSEDLITGLSEAGPGTKEVAREEVSIIKLVDLIISQAMRDRASDIHIEPEQNTTRIRFRIDGILHELPSPPKKWELPIISRIKILSDMDVAESRIPQDGHFQSKIEEKILDFRVATIPTIFGENVVLRLLDTASVTIGIEKLGFSSDAEIKRFENLISRPHGIILSTGPTGSGKTTTLYSALMRINTIDRNIITIEDPVEYRLGLIRQMQVNSRAGVTFANGLRAILRQDPDIIMVGEIRDSETAQIAIQAALTGHLVLSTLHTNDAPSAITRLVNMGIESFLISASLIGVMTQRLVRLICAHCKEPYEPTKSVLTKLSLPDKKGLVLYHGRGCDYCKGTGYYGRTGIFELMTIDDEIKEMIIAGASTITLRNKAQEKGMRLLREDGVAKVLAGITTFEEVARVCEEQVELKPEAETVEIKPFVPPTLSERRIVPEKVELKDQEVQDYEKRIANWLSRKK